MRIKVKLFASLDRFLPAGSSGNEADIEFADGTALGTVIQRLGLPPEHCHLVLVNGAFVEPSRRPDLLLRSGDVVAVWPNVAGG